MSTEAVQWLLEQAGAPASAAARYCAARPSDPPGARRSPVLQMEDGSTVIRLHGMIHANAQAMREWYGMDAIGAKDFREALQAAGSSDVVVEINSPGGMVNEAAQMVSDLHAHERANGKQVKVYVSGVCASAATFFTLGTRTVQISNLAQMMVHSPYACICGDGEALESAAKMLFSLRDEQAKLYAKRMGCSTADAVAAMNQETWYTASEAAESGLADEVVDVTSGDGSDIGEAEDDEKPMEFSVLAAAAMIA